ncbi:phytoene/squalene synthase family protein [Ktedonosporobacter rubrisoli]|uniref:Phytoene/squalene synthase family protein n=1 Tax=Ktedonosporobacter rubrisoli TaxID=2509675 RepID=A0A4P6JQJ3_KTERU|nr:phytoene/squalene synthase family protein [Ktedonosporobacter rubrisoli]QBD77412.1 phytoene/squalene synthase family protein [Ktedonosporobacter rubrisoli]
MNISENALDILKKTSRTFYIPISRLPTDLQAAVMSGYLCLRAIDEVEDHPSLDNRTKAVLLHAISNILQTRFTENDFTAVLAGYRQELPEVTLCVGKWALLAPASIAPRIWEATATMAERMAQWAEHNWKIQTEEDLDRYTFGVAGSVGLLLADLWTWYNGTASNRIHAVGFGRGLQSVNILRNHPEDVARGVEFFPVNWKDADMHTYARRNLALADAYTNALPPGPILDFCAIPLALAYATLDALARGDRKLNRKNVLEIVNQCSSEQA